MALRRAIYVFVLETAAHSKAQIPTQRNSEFTYTTREVMSISMRHPFKSLKNKASLVSRATAKHQELRRTTARSLC